MPKFLCILLLMIVCAACAQVPGKLSLPSEYHQGAVTIAAEVILPDSYTTASDKAYPVVYVLDGYWNKRALQEIRGALVFDALAPEFIIVSIDYPESISDPSQQRMLDLTPARDAGFKTGCNADDLLAILQKQLVPAINQQYRVDSEHQILIGHSLAGLFTVYSAYQAPQLFSQYLAISPSALWADDYLAAFDERYASASTSLPVAMYITYGTDEYRPYVLALERYIEQLQQRNYQGLNLQATHVHGLRHVSMKAEGYMRALVWAFANTRTREVSEFEKMNIDALKNRDQ